MSIAEKLSRSLGLESEAPTVEINVDVDEAGAPLDDVDMNGDPTPEADEAALMEAAEEIEDTNDDIDELEEAQATLESIYSAMHEDYQNGGMTPEAVKFAAIAVESVGVRYGITGEDVGISLESYQSDRKTASVISMEGVRDFISNVVDAIVKKLKELMQKLNEFYQKNIGAAARLKRRALSIKKKARSKSSGTAKEKTIGDDLFPRLNIRGSEPTVAQIVTGLKETTPDTKEKVRMTESQLDTLLKAGLTVNVLGDQQAYEDNLKSVANSTLGDVANGTLSSNFEVAGSKVSSDNFSGVVNLPGNVAIGIAIPSNSAIGADDVTKIRGGRFKDDNGVKSDKKNKLKTLSISEVESICDAVVDAMDAIVRVKSAKPSDGKAVTKVIEKHGDKIIKEISEDNNDSQLQARANKMLTAITTTFRADENYRSAVLNYNISLAKTSLSYCARSLSQYKKD